MKLDLVPESLPERLFRSLGLVPSPLIHTIVAMLMSRSIMVATRFGIFQALAEAPLTDDEVAAHCKLDPQATRKLLRALNGLGYLRFKNDRYELSRVARTWLLPDGRYDLTDAILHRYLDQKLIDGSEQYLTEGRPIDFHSHLSSEDWSLYVRGQKAHAVVAVSEIVKKIPLPRGAARMLDVGGSHGLFSDVMCRRHPSLHAVVLDLPEVVQHVDRTDVSDRVAFESGDILTQNLEPGAFDLVFIANLVHHFDADQNRFVIQKAARSLCDGGICVIADFVRPQTAGKIGQISALLDFYFGVTSGGGAWTADEMLSWLRGANLKTRRPIPIRRAPGLAILIGRK